MRSWMAFVVFAIVLVSAGGLFIRSTSVLERASGAELTTTAGIPELTTDTELDTVATTTTTTITLLPLAKGAADTTWDLVFADDFSEDALGETWVTCYWWVRDDGCTNEGNRNLQWYLPDGVSVDNGALRLTGRSETVSSPDGNFYDYVSGMVSTGREQDGPVGFSFEYGYVEARIRVPSGKGLWSAFWMLPITNSSRPEIDIMEILGHAPDKVEMHVHVHDASGSRVSLGSDSIGTDLSADWHTYAVDWNPNRIVWYVDGEETWRMSDSELVPAEPLYLIANLAIGGDWPGSPDENTELPAVYEIDYIRVWQEKSGT